MSSDPLPPFSPEPDPLQPVGSTPTPPVPPGATATTTTGLDANVAAGLAALFSLFGGIVFLVLEKSNQFVRFWAMQSLFFGATWFVFRLFSALLFHLLPGPLFYLWYVVAVLVNLAFAVVWIITIVKAFTGKTWEVPVVGKMARAQLAKPPVL